MLQEFEVTLTDNSTNTVRMFASSIVPILDFYNTFSSATVTQIKKIVYRNDKDDYQSKEYDSELKALLSTDKRNTNFSIHFVKKDLKLNQVINSIKQNITFLREPITKVNNVIIFKN